MGPSKRGRSRTVGAGDGRKDPATEARMTMMPVRNHTEPRQANHRGPKSSRPRGMSIDQAKGGNHTEARMTMMPVRGHQEAERTRGRSTVTPKTRERSRSESHALTAHGKPSTAAVPQTEARMTMMPVRSHRETDMKPSKPQEPPLRRRGIRTTNKTEEKGKFEAKKPSFWRRFLGLSEPQSAALKAGLSRSATVGRGSSSRRGQDISHGRKSYDVIRAPSTTGIRDLNPTHGGGRSRRATTSHGTPSTHGYSVHGSDESLYSLSSDDDDDDYQPSSGGYNGASTRYETYNPTGSYNGESTRYETYHPTGGYNGESTRYETYNPPTGGYNGASARYKTYNLRW